jgi:hypothetical protein
MRTAQLLAGLLPALLCFGQPNAVSEKFPWSLRYASAHTQIGVVSMLLSMGPTRTSWVPREIELLTSHP